MRHLLKKTLSRPRAWIVVAGAVLAVSGLLPFAAHVERPRRRRSLLPSPHGNNELFALLMRALPDSFIRMRSDGSVVDVQPMRDDRLLFPRTQPGDSVFSIAPDRFAEQLIAAAQNAVRHQTVQQFEYTLIGRLGDTLLSERLLTPADIQTAVQRQQSLAEQGRRVPLGEILVMDGIMTPAVLEDMLRRQRSQATVFDYEVRVVASDADDVLCIIRDITLRKRATLHERVQLERAEVKAALSQELSQVDLDYDSMLATVAEHVARAFSGVCVIHVRGAAHERLEPAAAHHYRHGVEASYTEQLASWQPPLDAGPAGQAIRTGLPVLVPFFDTGVDELRSQGIIPGPDIPITSLICAALQVRSQAIGVISVVRLAPSLAFQNDDLTYLQDLAARAALAIGDARLLRSTRQLGEDIRRSRDLLRTLFDSMDDGMLLLDGDGQILATNQALAGMLGRPVDSLMTMRWPDLCMLIDLRTGTRWPACALQSGDVFEERVRFERANAAATVLDVRLMAPNRLEPHLGHCIVQMVDVTERIQLELQLLETERFAASGRLAATVAHEINTPLQSVQAFLYLLGSAPAKERPAYVDMAQQEIDRIARILKQLLDLYRSGAALTTMVDLNSVIERVLLLIDHTVAQQRVIVTCAFDRALPLLWGRADQLTQMLVHLLVNAVQVTPSGGRVIVRTATATAHQCQLQHFGIIPEQLVAIVDVIDGGPGIPPEFQKHIFEPFHSARPGSTGLSLAICAQVVTEHRGTITHQNQEHHGSRFRIVLPIFTDSGLQVRSTTGHATGEH